MASATAMYHTGKNRLRSVRRQGGDVAVPRGLTVRRLHKAFLRWHDPANWPDLRQALRRMGREDLIGSRADQLIPYGQPRSGPDQRVGQRPGQRPQRSDQRPDQRPDQRRGQRSTERPGQRGPGPGSFATQHTGLPPMPQASAQPSESGPRSAPAGRRRRGAPPRSQ
jgi:hypothetical protein